MRVHREFVTGSRYCRFLPAALLHFALTMCQMYQMLDQMHQDYEISLAKCWKAFIFYQA